MTTGLIEINVTELRGAVALPAGLDRIACVIGCSSAGSGFQGPFLSGSAMRAVIGYGDGPDTCSQMIEQRQDGGATSVPKVPVFFCTVPATNVGTYGTIDIADVTGTCVPANGATTPLGTYTPATIEIVNGGTVGTAGVTYKWAIDYPNPDPNFSKPTALGTGTSITIPNSGTSFILQPPSATLTALYTKVTLLQTTMSGTGHFVLTAGSVHLAADTTDDTALAAVPAATTPATAVTLFNACKQYLGVHGASTVYHGIADATLASALAAIPTAANVADVDLYLDNLIAAYEAHRVLTTGTVHGAADSTNTITAWTPGPGTLIAGDTWTVATLAPYPAAADIDAAFVAMAATGNTFAIVVCEFPLTPSTADNVSDGLTLLKTAKGRRETCIARTDLPDFNASETEQAWADDVEADFIDYDDSRIHLRATYGLLRDALSGRTYRRSDLAQFAADTVRVDRSVYMGCPNDVPNGISNFSLTDYLGNLVGHDEGPGGNVTGLSNPDLGNRFGCNQRLGGVDGSLANAVFNTFPWVLYASDETMRSIMDRRIANAMERSAVILGVPQMGKRIFTNPADPNVPGAQPTLVESSRMAIQGSIYGGLAFEFQDDIANADAADPDTGLVQISPNVTRSAGGLVTVSVALVVNRVDYLMTLNFTYAVQG